MPQMHIIQGWFYEFIPEPVLLRIFPFMAIELQQYSLNMCLF